MIHLQDKLASLADGSKQLSNVISTLGQVQIIANMAENIGEPFIQSIWKEFSKDRMISKLTKKDEDDFTGAIFLFFDSWFTHERDFGKIRAKNRKTLKMFGLTSEALLAEYEHVVAQETIAAIKIWKEA